MRCLGVLLLVGSASGCTCGPSAADVAVDAAATAVVPADLVAASWPVQMATEADFRSFSSEPAWIALVMQRNVRDVVPLLGAVGGDGAARAHAEASLAFRQAALLAAHAVVETFGKTPEPSDPVGVAHLLTVGHALRGELAEARAASALLPPGDPTEPWHHPWRTWLAGPANWPPDLSGLPLGLPPVVVGGWPAGAPAPHYQLVERVEGGGARPFADPGALLALALWHEGAARLAAPGPALDGFLAGYRLPVEGAQPGGELTMPWLFGGELLVAADGLFLADLHGGAPAVDAWKDRSILAWLAHASRGSAGTIDAQLAVDRVADLRDAIAAASSARTGGEVQAHQRQFGEIAFTGALRGLALVAEVEGDREQGGRLRINAWEHSHKATAWPAGLLALAAWDASNRYPSRALDILHAQVRRMPELDPARYALDALALRVGRERPGETPGI